MNNNKKFVTFCLFLISWYNYSQLGFCTGSKGSAVFSETFGNGTNYGPALPAGVTNYNYVTGSPNDGSYTLFYRTNLYSTWHYSLDHTPDATDGTNGKALIVNANASTTGDFYKRTVTGLCANTTFEFSAWLMNVYNPGSSFCGAAEIPINVRFEIWNDNETVLLQAGNTGNIIGTNTPIWQQFALVFTTTNQTSVVLKMKNNGLGGCGNDLAIDDIEFKSCGELTTISSPLSTGSTFTSCGGIALLQLQATTTGSSTYFYQWQTSTNGTTWTDIVGANTASFTTPNLTSQTFFRTKVAQDASNLSNNFCSTISNVFTVSFFGSPSNAISNGNLVICSNQTIPQLSVAATTGTGVNWYDAPSGGNILQSNATSYTPTAAGTFYAEVYNLSTNCKSSARTAVSLTIIPAPFATVAPVNAICAGNSTNVFFNGTPNAIINFTVDGGTIQTITLNSAGIASLTTPILNASSTYRLVSAVSSVSSTCLTPLSDQVSIIVNSTPSVVISGVQNICNGSSTLLTFTGTPTAVVTFRINSGTDQNVILNNVGLATINTANLTSNTNYALVSIATTNASACTQTLSQIFEITVDALPTASISAAFATVCSGYSTPINFSGTPNATITYSVNSGVNQFITLNNVGFATISSGILTSLTTYQLRSITSSSTLSCFQTLSDTASIAINQSPIASFSGSVTYCSNQPLNISLTSNISGTTFTWTVLQNNVSGASAGSGTTINQVLNANAVTANAIYSITPIYNGCAGAPIQINVTIYTLPKPVLTNGVICLSSASLPASQFYTLSTDLNASDYTFEWFFNAVPISASNSNFYNAYQIGNYSVVATNITTGCRSDIVSASVTESIKGESLIIDQVAFFSDNPTVTVTVIGGDGPFLYQIDDTGFQSSNIFTGVAPGLHTINVVDKTFCTNLTATTTIIDYPRFFTPNGDSYNDYWKINGLPSTTSILIYDRFGKLITQISSNSNGWDGTFAGQPLFADDYWFVINYVEKGVDKIFKSHFALKR